MKTIFSITRQDLIDDGELILVSGTILKDTRVCFPAAITSALHAKIKNMPNWEDYEGRVYDMLYMFTMAVSGHIPSKKQTLYTGEALQYEFILNDSSCKADGVPTVVSVKAIVGPGDCPDDHPVGMPPPAVLTFMLPEED